MDHLTRNEAAPSPIIHVPIANIALRKARRGETALGFGIHHLRTVASSLIAAATDHDWLFIDAELGAFSIHDIAQIATAAVITGPPAIVRVRPDDLGNAARALDNGASGIIVAHVESADQASAIVRALRFAPLGRRSWGAACPGFRYAPGVRPECAASLDAETLIAPMIESRAGVDAADAIAALDGIDGLFIGAQDLSLALGMPSDFASGRFLEAVDMIAAACHRHRKVLGIGGIHNPEDLATIKPERFGLILTGSDHVYLQAGARQRAAAIRTAIAEAAR